MNEILHRLTGRLEGFVWEEFSSGIDAPALVSHPDVLRVRELLGLDIPATDYFVVGALGTLDQHPELAVLLPRDVNSYRLELYRPPGYHVIGGSLVAQAGKPPSVLVVPDAWPASLGSILRYHSPTAALLTRGARGELVPLQILDDGRLRLDWPSWSGISGLLQPDQPWGVDGALEFVHTPCTYPHHLIVPLLKNDDAPHRVLNRAGLMDSFTASQRDSERVAVLLTSLILTAR